MLGVVLAGACFGLLALEIGGRLRAWLGTRSLTNCGQGRAVGLSKRGSRTYVAAQQLYASQPRVSQP